MEQSSKSPSPYDNGETESQTGGVTLVLLPSCYFSYNLDKDLAVEGSSRHREEQSAGAQGIDLVCSRNSREAVEAGPWRAVVEAAVTEPGPWAL